MLRPRDPENFGLLTLDAVQVRRRHSTWLQWVDRVVAGLGALAVVACAGTILFDPLGWLGGAVEGAELARAVGDIGRTAHQKGRYLDHCSTPGFSAASRFGVARGENQDEADHAAILLDYVGECVRIEMGLVHTGLVDLRVQPENLAPGIAGHTCRSPFSVAHVCIDSTSDPIDLVVLAHELFHIWNGTLHTLPLIEEGKADLVALRAVPQHASQLLYGRQWALRRLFTEAALDGEQLLKVARAPDWNSARELLGHSDESQSSALYALGMETALRMESGAQLGLEESLTPLNSALLALRMENL